MLNHAGSGYPCDLCSVVTHTPGADAEILRARIIVHTKFLGHAHFCGHAHQTAEIESNKQQIKLERLVFDIFGVFL